MKFTPPSREWLLRMADMEEKSESISVGGWMFNQPPVLITDGSVVGHGWAIQELVVGRKNHGTHLPDTLPVIPQNMRKIREAIAEAIENGKSER